MEFHLVLEAIILEKSYPKLPSQKCSCSKCGALKIWSGSIQGYITMLDSKLHKQNRVING